MDDRQKQTADDIIQNEFPVFIQMLEQNFDFSRWGLSQYFVGVAQSQPIVVYASPACRVRFSWPIPDIRDRATIQIYYGRSHAPVDEDIIPWNGVPCWCWHDVRNVLCFLDGISANETVSNRLGQPRIMQEFRNASIQSWTQPEFMTKMHATIWKQYGQRLFDVFDVRQTSLWEQFSNFMAEYAKLDPGYTLGGFPARDKIC
jgi:hypothetical protein